MLVDFHHLIFSNWGSLVDCKVSQWGGWGSCSEVSIYLSGGTKTRRRVVVREAKHGGVDCPDLEESNRCKGFLFLLQRKATCPNLGVGVCIYLYIILPMKRFERPDFKCHHDHWPGSSACSSPLPFPGMLRKVSFVNFEPKDFKKRM